MYEGTKTECHFWFNFWQRIQVLRRNWISSKKYEELNYCILRDFRILKAATRRCPKPVSIANPALEYLSMKCTYKFSGYPLKEENCKRNTKSSQKGCPFENYFSLWEDQQTFVIQKKNEAHNNLVSVEIYKHIPCKRILLDSFKGNFKMLFHWSQIERSYSKKKECSGINVTLKDIANMKQYQKFEFKTDDLESTINYLKGRGRTSPVEITFDFYYSFCTSTVAIHIVQQF